jgi:hypothetical protein
LPVPQSPHERGWPVQVGASSPALAEANTESFLLNLVEPQCGQDVPSQLTERTNTSLSFPHLPH